MGLGGRNSFQAANSEWVLLTAKSNWRGEKPVMIAPQKPGTGYQWPPGHTGDVSLLHARRLPGQMGPSALMAFMA